jgi:O-antigen/teichoic acid export membrane protein
MRELKISNFYIKSGLFSVLSILGAAIGYVTYPLLAHILSVREFGNFTVVIATSNQILSILVALNIVSIYLVKNNSKLEAHDKIKIIQRVLIWSFIALSIVLLLAAPLLKNLLHIQSSASFIALLFILLFSVPANMWTGYLQGNKELIRIGVYSLFSSFFKLVGAVGLAFYFGVQGGLWGIALGMLLGLVILKYTPGVKPPKLSTVFVKPTASESFFIKRFWPYLIQSIFVVGGLGLLQNFDIILAKSSFAPVEAGLYAGVSVLSNALYYALFLLIWIVLPEIDIHNQTNNKRILSTSYKLIVFIGLLAIIVELVLRRFVVSILLGKAFSSQEASLIYATLYQITLLSISLYAFYLLIIRSRRAIVLAGLVMTNCLVWPAIFAHNTQQMITDLWLSELLGVAIYSIINVYFKIDGHGKK